MNRRLDWQDLVVIFGCIAVSTVWVSLIFIGLL